MIVTGHRAAIIYEIGVVDGQSTAVIACDASPREILEVIEMPRTVQEILDHPDESAQRFEEYEPSPANERNPEVFAELRRAVVGRSDAERTVRDAVAHAREHGYSWAFIGSMIGTTGDAARQRYGRKLDA